MHSQFRWDTAAGISHGGFQRRQVGISLICSCICACREQRSFWRKRILLWTKLQDSRDTAARPGFIKDFIACTECLRGNTERYTGIRKGVNDSGQQRMSFREKILSLREIERRIKNMILSIYRNTVYWQFFSCNIM